MGRFAGPSVGTMAVVSAILVLDLWTRGGVCVKLLTIVGLSGQLSGLAGLRELVVSCHPLGVQLLAVD